MQFPIKLCSNVTCKTGINIIFNTVLYNNFKKANWYIKINIINLFVFYIYLFIYLFNNLSIKMHTKSTNFSELKQSDIIRGLLEPQTPSRLD